MGNGDDEWSEDAGVDDLILSGEGKRVHTKIRLTPIRLKVAPRRCLVYIVACLKQARNYNGTGIVCRIVMVRFKNGRIIMAQIQLTL